MKTLILFPLLFLLIGLNKIYAQSKLSISEVDSLICFKWKVTEAYIDNQKISMDMIGEADIEFFKDSSFKVNELGEKYNGKWVFNPENQSLETDDRDGKGKHKVLKLTSTELITQFVSKQGIGTIKFKYKKVLPNK